MLETPEASPICSAATEAVAADDDGPFDSPIPTAMATSGSRNTRYCHDAFTKPIAAKPAAVIAKPAPMICRGPNRPASRGTSGATTTRPTVAGSVASPACSGERPSVDGSWK